MVAAAEVRMGRPKGKRTERDDVSVKIDRAVASKAKIIAGDRGIHLAELLTEMLGPMVDKSYLQLMRKLDSTAGVDSSKFDVRGSTTADMLPSPSPKRRGKAGD